MKESKRNTLFWVFSALLLCILGSLAYLKIIHQDDFYTGDHKIFDYGISIVFLAMLGLIVNELLHWRKQGKRSEAFDLVLLVFIFVTIYLATYDPTKETAAAPVMNSLIGAFGMNYENMRFSINSSLLLQ
jgi:hypothetical protein